MSHVREGWGTPLAMHCKETALYFTTVLSAAPEDLIVGGTRFREEKREGIKIITTLVKCLKSCM